jgi:hypothetical protein
MGLAEQALGQWVAADHDVREALEAKGDTWVESRRAVLESAVATIARRLGSLEVRAGSAAGDVYVDGVKIGSLPMEGARRVEAGTRTLEVRTPGFYPVSRTIIVMPGETTRESIDLVPLPAAPVVAAPPGAPASEAKGSLAESAPAPSNGTSRTLAIAGFAIAGASLAVAFVGLGVRASEISSYNANGTCPGAASPSQPEACAGYLSAASTWRTVSIASFIGAGVLGATAVVLLVTAPSHSPARSPAHAVACRGGFAAVGCTLSF